MYRTCLGIGTLLALAAGPAFAQNDNTAGFYLGVGLGDFSSNVDAIDDPDDLDDVGLEFDEDESARRLFAGWRFNRFVAAQLDYTEFGESTAVVNLLDLTSETTGLSPTIVGTLPIGPVELFAKAGMIFYDVEVNSAAGSIIDESGEDPIYGVGIGFTVLERLSLRAEYEEIDIEELEEADAVWVTASWRF